MTDDPKKPPEPSLDMPFDEAMKRLIQTDPGELADAHERIRQEQAEVRARVKEARNDINRGIRPPGRKLRL